jgi:gamma-glutamylcyclotransferase (GGCT)/AIG2-like uncharacterized protein YtfP
MKTVKVFVYGTLKTGLYNNRILQRHGAKSLGVAFSQQDDIVLVNGTYYPYCKLVSEQQMSILFDNGVTGLITGELFEAPKSVMRELDCLEGYPNHYNIRQVSVCLDNDDSEYHTAWMYYQERYVEPGDEVCMQGYWWPRITTLSVNEEMVTK